MLTLYPMARFDKNWSILNSDSCKTDDIIIQHGPQLQSTEHVNAYGRENLLNRLLDEIWEGKERRTDIASLNHTKFMQRNYKR
jgi:hypothetical protein